MLQGFDVVKALAQLSLPTVEDEDEPAKAFPADFVFRDGTLGPRKSNFSTPCKESTTNRTTQHRPSSAALLHHLPQAPRPLVP